MKTVTGMVEMHVEAKVRKGATDVEVRMALRESAYSGDPDAVRILDRGIV